jgi:flagellar biosynthetic protein FliR
MPNFGFSPEELLVFFAVLVRYSTLVAVLPVTGDRTIPTPVKVLFSLAVTIALFPALLRNGEVRISEAHVWGRSTGGIVSTVVVEAMFGLILGYVAKLCFDAINIGANMAGNFMGFAMASQYDPHQETQSQVIAEIQMAFAMLMFLALDGHHFMLKSAFSSYQIVGIGRAGITEAFSRHLTELTSQVFGFGLQLAAPVAMSVFFVNVGFGIIGKALPQLNIFVLAMGVTALVGLGVTWLAYPELATAMTSVMERMTDWMRLVSESLVKSG